MVALRERPSLPRGPRGDERLAGARNVFPDCLGFGNGDGTLIATLTGTEKG
jgi:hypothetical protein